MRGYLWAELLLFKVLRIVFFYPTHQHAHRVVILAAMIRVAWSIYLTLATTDSITMKFFVGNMMTGDLGVMLYLLFAEGPFPDHWRRVRDEVHAAADEDGLKKLPSNFCLTKKLWWMVDISHNLRMIGWVQEPRGYLPPHPPPSRRTFLRKTLFKLIVNIFAADVAISVLALSPAFDNRVHDPTDGPETYLTAVPFLHRVPYILSSGVRAAASAGVIHNFTSLMFVGLGYSSPTLWPDIWGRWRDAYTLRKFWG